MITLITGTPNAGKTAWIVNEITRLPSQRKVYVHGIPELKIAHEPVYCTSELCDYCRSQVGFFENERVSCFLPIDSPYLLMDDPARHNVSDEELLKYSVLLLEEWNEWAAHGSLIVADEVQRVWRPSSKLPDDIAALETHRHKGLDFWLGTQSPSLTHSNVCKLVSRHIHLVSAWDGRHEFEYPECRFNTSSRADAVKRAYKLPRRVFGLYRSSTLHTKIKHRKPVSYYLFIAVLIFAVALSFYTLKRFKSKFEPMPAQSETGGVASGVAQAEQTNVAASFPPGQVMQANFLDFKPRVENVPESAPAYDALVKVKQAPILAGCVKTKDDCKCFTHQATPYPATTEYCTSVVEGKRFNPYLSGTSINEGSQQPLKKGS